MARNVGEITREDIENSDREFKRLLNNYINSLTNLTYNCAKIGIKVKLPKFKNEDRK